MSNLMYFGLHRRFNISLLLTFVCY